MRRCQKPPAQATSDRELKDRPTSRCTQSVLHAWRMHCTTCSADDWTRSRAAIERWRRVRHLVQRLWSRESPSTCRRSDDVGCTTTGPGAPRNSKPVASVRCSGIVNAEAPIRFAVILLPCAVQRMHAAPALHVAARLCKKLGIHCMAQNRMANAKIRGPCS